jgi:hypothetical protein
VRLADRGWGNPDHRCRGGTAGQGSCLDRLRPHGSRLVGLRTGLFGTWVSCRTSHVICCWDDRLDPGDAVLEAGVGSGVLLEQGRRPDIVAGHGAGAPASLPHDRPLRSVAGGRSWNGAKPVRRQDRVGTLHLRFRFVPAQLRVRSPVPGRYRRGASGRGWSLRLLAFGALAVAIVLFVSGVIRAASPGSGLSQIGFLLFLLWTLIAGVYLVIRPTPSSRRA